MKIMKTWMGSVVLSGALAMGASAAVAGGGQKMEAKQGQSAAACPKETKTQADARTSKMRQVSGMVVGMKTVEMRGEGPDHTVVLVKTNKADRRIAVDLGPNTQKAMGKFKEGDKVALSGVVVELDGQQVFIADKIKANGRISKIDRKAQAMQFAESQKRNGRSDQVEQRAKANGQDRSNY